MPTRPLLFGTDFVKLLAPAAAVNHCMAIGADNGKILKTCKRGLGPIAQWLLVMNVGVGVSDLRWLPLCSGLP
jgi:hypothetical protein